MRTLWGTVERAPRGAPFHGGIGVRKVNGQWSTDISGKHLNRFYGVFGGLFPHDIGRRVYLNGVMQMESDAQRQAREGSK